MGVHILNNVLKKLFASQPINVKGQNSIATMYYKDKLLRLIFGLFEFNLPDTWDKDYFLTTLFLTGHIGIVDTVGGVLPLKCGYSGLNVFERPTTINISNIVLGTFNRTIGVDGVLLKLQYNYRGITPILNFYAEKLASCDCAIDVNLMNSRVATIFEVEDKAQQSTAEKFFDELSHGKPAVFIKKNTGINHYKNDVKQQFIANDVQMVKRQIVNEFLTEIGIANTNTDKRERLNTDEVNSNNEECDTYINHWIDNIQRGFDDANKLFDLDLSFKVRRSSQRESMERGVDDE